MSWSRSFLGVDEVGSVTIGPLGRGRGWDVVCCEGAWMISNWPSVPFLSKGGKCGGVMKGLIGLSAGLAAGEMAFVIANHMPPLPLELIVMLE